MFYPEPDLEKPYQDSQSHEWSKAAETAFDTLENLKKAKADLMWISGNEKEKTSYGVTIRWERLRGLVAYIEQPIIAYSKPLYAGLEAALKSELDDMDSANVDYEGDEGPTEHFGYYLDQYAEVIIAALKKEMRCDDWGDDVEAELFENNR